MVFILPGNKTTQMNKRVASIINSKNKAPLYPQNGKKMEFLGGKSQPEDKTANKRRVAKERKLALLQDVDNLKKKLRHEENVHRALERAFNRPLGALPRLPPYLPQYILELLAEVAVLEEEVVRLEEQVVNCRQGLYQEAVFISSKRSAEDLITPSRSDQSLIRSSKPRHSRSSSQSEATLGSFLNRSSTHSLSRSSSTRTPEISSIRTCQHLGSENGSGEENQCFPNSGKTSLELEIRTPVKHPPLKPEQLVKNVEQLKMECRIIEQAHSSSSGSSDDRTQERNSETNRISEDILKCLINIFVRLGLSKGKTMDFESMSSNAFSNSYKDQSDFRDPYGNSSLFKIGNYKNLYTVEAQSIDLNRKKNASFLIRRLKLLLDKLVTVKLDGLSHRQKLAFWINIYNSCIMNAFLENGIPENADMIVLQMQKATIKVGGHLVNALMIEHLILRLPYHLKYTCNKSSKTDQSKVCQTFGLEWSEPLVTFALSCGSWSSPAVRVYTAPQIETELETAKRDYLQAAVAISLKNKIIIPKLLDWYLLDFAKDLDALLDWVCLQLPDELRKEVAKCIDRRGKEPLSEIVHVAPYNFNFRYLVCR